MSSGSISLRAWVKASLSASQSMSGSPGSTYEVSMAGGKVTGVVKDTGDWARFIPVELGTITVEKAGKYRVAVKCLKKTGSFVMNLRSITLTRVK